MFALNQLPALTIGMPDVCLTPVGPVVIPVPYPNIAQEVLGFPAPYNVIVGGAPVHNMGTTLPLSLGDLPGVAGVASGTVMGPHRSLTNATTCLMGSLPTRRVGSCGPSNTMNTIGIAAVPNQFKVVLLCA